MTTHASARLWEKGTTLDAAVHRFTVGDDPKWDAQLVHWDCLGSAAHARGLHRAGLLSDAELRALLSALAECDRRAQQGEFEIPPELEDCHTAIEAELIATCGEIGERIHAGRSRNDQVATALRLFMRHHALCWLDLLARFAAAVVERGRCDGGLAMPGYTHMQLAMPSSVGQWLHAIAEASLEQLRAGLDLLSRLDACPLGTGAGFGVPLPLDREFTARLLGFSRVQRSPADVQNSRGRLEKYFLRVAADTGALLEKMCSDVLLLSSAAYGFFTLPEALTTGSSLMPQKRNPDVLELLRARAARLGARLVELESVTGKLPSGYHRDLQLTKEPTVRTAGELAEMLAIATRLISELQINAARLEAAMRPELYATHAALALVRQGMPFRAAYRRIAAELAEGRFDSRGLDLATFDASRVSGETWQAVAAEIRELTARADELRQSVITAESTAYGA